MDKDKLTDRIDLTEENIDNINDPQASSHFKRIFEEDGKILEEEALASSYEVDEERKEALRLRILEAAAAQGLLEDEDARGRDAAGRGNTAVETEDAETPDGRERKKREKRKKRSYSSLLRWAAVIALVCLGVFGASVTSQAKGSGLWSTIQRLIGVETRWEHENNGADRTYTNPQEEKAISEIEEMLGIRVPNFFYWPGELKFVNCEIFQDNNSFIMIYQDGDRSIFLEGYCDKTDTSATKVWEGEGKTYYQTYDGFLYTIVEIENEHKEKYHYVTWDVDDSKYALTAIISTEELEKILKNIKN